MKAIAVAVPNGKDGPSYPHLHLSGDEVKRFLGDFSFEQGVLYEVPITFEVVGWHKGGEGEYDSSSLDLCIREGGTPEEVGKAPPKAKKPAKEEPEVEVEVAEETDGGY